MSTQIFTLRTKSMEQAKIKRLFTKLDHKKHSVSRTPLSPTCAFAFILGSTDDRDNDR